MVLIGKNEPFIPGFDGNRFEFNALGFWQAKLAAAVDSD
jgi:hypothetical protein